MRECASRALNLRAGHLLLAVTYAQLVDSSRQGQKRPRFSVLIRTGRSKRPCASTSSRNLNTLLITSAARARPASRNGRIDWLVRSNLPSSQDSLTCAPTHVDTIIINLTMTHRQCCGAMRDRRRVQLRVMFHRGVNVSFRVEPGGFSVFWLLGWIRQETGGRLSY